MDLNKIFVDYWSQILLLIGGVSYLVKFQMESTNRLKEKRQDIFLKKKLLLLKIMLN